MYFIVQLLIESFISNSTYRLIISKEGVNPNQMYSYELLALLMIHLEAKQGFRTAEDMWFESHEGSSFFRSVTYDP